MRHAEIVNIQAAPASSSPGYSNLSVIISQVVTVADSVGMINDEGDGGG